MDDISALLQQGQRAFEQGNYAQAVNLLGQAATLAEGNVVRAGEIQLWLVMAHSAVGDQTAALTLCRQLQRHPDRQTRQESRRLLAILEAPQLKRHPEWYSQIPDLSHVGDRPYTSPYAHPRQGKTATSPTPAAPPPPATPLPNAFIWIALLSLGLLTALAAWP
ncbi:hypothetical protein RYO59_001024 [Thermosynechococcaceae cyanobacterium Okahandja]